MTIEPAAPPFTHLIKTEAVPESDAVNIYVGTADKTGYKLVVSAAIVPALLTELSGRLSQLPAADRPAAHIKPHEITLSMGTSGQPALVLSMGGYQMAFSMDVATVKVLHDAMGQMLNRN